MSRTGLMMSACALALALGTTGCDGDTRTGDGGTIMLMDSGTPVDSGPPPTPDTGPPPTGTCAISTVMALPAACLPRCTMATGQAVAACADVTCLTAALEADATPPIPIMTPDPSLSSLDCDTCYSLQVTSCVIESCPTEFQAFAMCQQTAGADCSTQDAAVDACIMASPTFQSCGSMRASQCFSTTAGFLPSLPPTLELPPGIFELVSRYEFTF